jgi:ribonucleotide monophosphatase NagD (HAD superfamily)
MVAHVGDSLHHDVAGANATGIASVFVVGGVHREELGVELGVLPSNTALEEVFHEHGQTPTHVVPLLKL